MPRPGYLSYRLTPDRRRQITALAERLHLAPDDETKILDFAIQFTLFHKETKMNARTAIKKLAVLDVSDEIVTTLFDAVEPLCRTETDGGTDAETTLWDWIREGALSGGIHLSDTPRSIAQEWDSLR